MSDSPFWVPKQHDSPAPPPTPAEDADVVEGFGPIAPPPWDGPPSEDTPQQVTPAGLTDDDFLPPSLGIPSQTPNLPSPAASSPPVPNLPSAPPPIPGAPTVEPVRRRVEPLPAPTQATIHTQVTPQPLLSTPAPAVDTSSPAEGQVQSQDVPSSPSKKRRRFRTFTIGTLVAGIIAAIGFGGWYAYGYLSGGGPQPSDVLPKNTVGYIRFDLDPSLTQKVGLAKTVGNVIGSDDATVDDLAKMLFEDGLNLNGCGISYTEDVKPWLGKRFAIAAIPGENAPVVPAVVIQTTNEDKTAKMLDSINACDTLNGLASSVGGGYVVFTEAGEASTAVTNVQRGKAASLEANPEYQETTTRLGDQGFASFWVNPDVLAETVEQTLPSTPPPVSSPDPLAGAPAPPENTESMWASELAGLQKIDSIAGVLRLSQEGVFELPVETTYMNGKAPETTTPIKAISKTPESAIGVISFGDIRQIIEDAFDSADTLGLSLLAPEGLLPDNQQSIGSLLRKIVGSDGLIAFGGAGEGFWVSLLSDYDVKTVKTGLQKVNPFDKKPFVVAATAQGTVISNNKIGVEAFASPTRLVETELFNTMVGDYTNSMFVAYLNTKTFSDALGSQMFSNFDAVAVNMEIAKNDIQKVTLRVKVSANK